jgi:hypothetical protein
MNCQIPTGDCSVCPAKLPDIRRPAGRRAEVPGWAAQAINFGLDWRQPGTMLVDGVSPVLKRPRVVTTARAPIARNAKARNISAEGISRVGVSPRKGSRKREELNAECIKIATSTAPPDALNANPINCERPISIRMKTWGDALLQLTRKSGACHAAQRTPTQIAATHGGMICCKRACRNPRQANSSKSGPPRRL